MDEEHREEKKREVSWSGSEKNTREVEKERQEERERERTSRVITLEQYSINRGIWKIMSDVTPSCLVTPLI